MPSNGKPPVVWPRVIGQQRVKGLLLNAIKRNRMPHAFLFHGNEGVGKDAMALELARVLHCERGGEQACDECSSCRRMNTLQHPDVHLVTALPVGKNETAEDAPLARLTQDEIQSIQEQFRLKAGNPYHIVDVPRATIIKINSIREVRRASSMSTSNGRTRVFIISRADEMGEAASNTILKTLEEPAGHTMLILTTSHRDALLPTIVSRCQDVRFDSLTEYEIAEALVQRNGVEPEESLLVARLANGSYSRALELQQEDLARERQDVLMFVKESLAGNTVTLANRIDDLSSSRDRDPVRRFLNLLLLWFRDAFSMRHGGTVINVDQNDDLQRFITKFHNADLVRVIAGIERAISLIDRNVYIKLVFLQLAVEMRRSIAEPGLDTR